MKKKDWVLFSIILIIICLCFLFIKLICREDGASVRVIIDGKVMGEYLLSRNGEYLIEGNECYNILVIDDNKAYIKEASCPDGICVNHKSISKSGEAIICIPNKLVITVVSKEKSDLDAVAY